MCLTSTLIIHCLKAPDRKDSYQHQQLFNLINKLICLVLVKVMSVFAPDRQEGNKNITFCIEIEFGYVHGMGIYKAVDSVYCYQ